METEVRTKALGAYGVWTDYATHPGHDAAGYSSEVCSVFRGNNSDFPREIRDANAKLIAAAPDLLAAAMLVIESAELENWDRYKWTDEPRGGIAELRAAIAKAIGK